MLQRNQRKVFRKHFRRKKNLRRSFQNLQRLKHRRTPHSFITVPGERIALRLKNLMGSRWRYF